MGLLDEVKKSLVRGRGLQEKAGLPFVTVSYAQSLDGSIALRSGYPLAISCPESRLLTHSLRALHEGILVGIGTVLADDPQLTVRNVPGQNPQPIILDSRLRFPPYARLLKGNGRRPWIFAAQTAEAGRARSLEASGAVIFRFLPDPDGRIGIRPLLKSLAEQGVLSLMVEGGAQVITSFLLARMVNQMVISIAPSLVGGTRVIEALAGRGSGPFPQLTHIDYERVGEDLVLRADPVWT